MVNYNPYINWVGFHPLYIYVYTKQPFFFHCSNGGCFGTMVRLGSQDGAHLWTQVMTSSNNCKPMVIDLAWKGQTIDNKNHKPSCAHDIQHK